MVYMYMRILHTMSGKNNTKLLVEVNKTISLKHQKHVEIKTIIDSANS